MKQPTETRYKLNEARFFLDRIQADWRNLPDFDFYLSAFVSAARSVTWVMRAEYGKAPDWEAWFDKKAPTARRRELLKRMNIVRVRATKTRPIRTRAKVNLSVPVETFSDELSKLSQPGTDLRFRLIPVDASNTEMYIVVNDRIVGKGNLDNAEHELPEFGGVDSTAVCLEYFDELESLVSECEARFEL